MAWCIEGIQHSIDLSLTLEFEKLKSSLPVCRFCTEINIKSLHGNIVGLSKAAQTVNVVMPGEVEKMVDTDAGESPMGNNINKAVQGAHTETRDGI